SILIGGSFTRPISKELYYLQRNGYAVMKLRSDGTLDPSFGDATHHQIADDSIDGPFELTNLSMASDGSLYMMIYNFPNLVEDGIPDHILYHYGAAGTHVLQTRDYPAGETVSVAEDMGLEADGHIVVIGQDNATGLAFAMQLNTDLTINPTFGNNGMSEFGYTYLFDHVLLPADNSIILYGKYGFADDGAAIQEFRLRRFLGGAETGHAEPGESALNRPVGILDIVGTDDGDEIILSRHGSQIFVEMNGVVQRYPASKVFTIMIRSGGGDDHVIVAGGVPGAYVHGGDGNDTIHGGDGNDSITGGGGRDLIVGGAGDDLLNGSGANDTISGEDGDDRVFGGVGNDSLFGGNGDDHVAGAEGDDFLEGDSGADLLEDFYGQNRIVKDGLDNVQILN
ncbi:MAG TPA: calcium-binding protein, partial [Tepidisphaeraceae bacterium]|nr:calcium-binding protein [Tepidisphaeraceae bacterium]